MGGHSRVGGTQQSQAPLQKALLKVKTAAAEVVRGAPLRAGWGRCAPGLKKCKNGCAVQPGGRGHGPGTGTMPRPRDRDNDPPRDTARGRGARPRHRDEPGALAATQAPRDPSPRPPPHPPRPAHSLGPPPHGGRENTAPESPTGVGTPQKRKGERQSPRSLPPPAPNTARSEVAPALAGAGGPCRGEGAQHGPPPPGKGTVGPGRG